MSQSILVIGHRNPDTDAICSAIGYAWFLRETAGLDAVAACCGEITPRTQYVLDRAGLPPPRLVMDVRPTVGRICVRKVVTVREGDALFEVYGRLRARDLRSVPVLDGAGRLTGMLTLSRLLELLLPAGGQRARARYVDTSLERIRAVLQGEFAHAVEAGRTETLAILVGAMSAEGFRQRMHDFKPAEVLLVAGDRPTIQLPAIEFGVRGIVVTGGYRLSDELLEEARARGVSVLHSPLDTASTTLLIRSARVITGAVEGTFQHFPESARVGDVAREVAHSHQEAFPVVDEAGQLCGIFTKSDLVQPERLRLILVDHNEFSQAVPGVEEADVLEVIDHHRVGGGLMTRQPIRFINEPVGSTCTIITKFLQHRELAPPPGIALCLAAGLISDTLHLTSPTTTPTDRLALDWLGRRGGFDVAEFARALLAAGSALQAYPPEVALRSDLKEYAENGWRFAVSQIEETGFELFRRHQSALAGALTALVRERQLDFAVLLVTDITRHNSFLLLAGDDRVRGVIDYPEPEPGVFDLAGVVSRKKQLLPHLARLLGDLPK
jgi:manganese-dependent inorganic pyrophosphatase